MGAESKIKKMQAIQDRVYELSARVSENTAKAGLHRSKVEENQSNIVPYQHSGNKSGGILCNSPQKERYKTAILFFDCQFYSIG